MESPEEQRKHHPARRGYPQPGRRALEQPDGLSADQRVAGHAASLHRHLVHLPSRRQEERITNISIAEESFFPCGYSRGLPASRDYNRFFAGYFIDAPEKPRNKIRRAVVLWQKSVNRWRQVLHQKNRPFFPSIELLNRIYNGTSHVRNIKEEKFFEYTLSIINRFLQLVSLYLESPSSENAKAVRDELAIDKEMLGFKYWIIRDKQALFDVFAQDIIWNKN